MNSKFIIDLKGFENYRVDEHGNIWKLPFVSKSGKNISLKIVIKDKEKKRWKLTRFDKLEWWSEHQLRPYLIRDNTPIVLTKEDDLPF